MKGYKAVKGYNGQYVITDCGQVLSNKGKKVRILRASVGGVGYKKVVLSKNNKKKTEHIHRLVAEAFCKKPDVIGLDVHHIDGNKLNNHHTNLEWIGYYEHAEVESAVKFKIISPSGEVIEGYNISKFCRSNRMDESHLTKVLNGKRKHHKGYTKG